LPILPFETSDSWLGLLWPVQDGVCITAAPLGVVIGSCLLLIEGVELLSFDQVLRYGIEDAVVFVAAIFFSDDLVLCRESLLEDSFL
jgi:hypothetical protein